MEDSVSTVNKTLNKQNIAEDSGDKVKKTDNRRNNMNKDEEDEEPAQDPS